MRKGVQKIYSEVVETYELVNHVLTLGLDIFWRKKAAQQAIKFGGNFHLDVCSGTGEMAQHLSKLAENQTQIVSVDFSYPMLSKAKEKKHSSNLFFLLGDAKTLPFQAETFDLVIISFATRNLCQRKEILTSHLKEFHRIIKPGGCFINLETSQPQIKIIQKIFHAYIKVSVKPLGSLLSGSNSGYRYLSYTIPRFFPAKEFTEILKETGFSQVTHQSLLLGVSAIHTAIK